VDAFLYEDKSFNMSSFSKYFKDYMNKLSLYLRSNHPERVEPLKKNSKPLLEFILKNFEEFSFYIPKSLSDKNMIMMSWYKN